MPAPDRDVIVKMTRETVLNAHKSGTLSNLTPRVIREKLEDELELEEGALKSFKRVIQDTIAETLSEVGNGEESHDEEEEHQEAQKPVASKAEPKKLNAKGKQKEATEKKPSKKPSKTEQSSSVSPAGGKKRKSATGIEGGTSKAKKPRTSIGANTKEKKAFTSAAVVPPSSDVDEDTDTKPAIGTTSHMDDKPASSSPLAQSKQTSKSHEPDVGTESPPQPEEEPEKSDSELSVLIDEPPKRKKKGKAKDSSEPSEAKKRKKGAASTTLSKDEETIKRLKSFVNACGVRKVWSKVFKDISDSPSKQIALLRKMLAELGMTGRLSLEQAKAIKERRELASELADVQSFEQSMKNQTSRSSRASKKETSDAESEKSSDEEDEENARPAKRKINARQSIMAFLGDQSDSE
ncbi:hypothetical protein F5878DRAFT_294261 [Lentinula raphanica]|uniref:DEK C-terminal domain-containing protein n=1 Tax=Lentinula raphanica TaxID=153919 RepID=A0AA38UBL3_9AGAR|nr:hypothetical protein F5878DRAFT_294261 [Lentinula raphanica]